MAGSRALRKIQLGLETTSGTPVASTVTWRGVGVVKDQRDVVHPEEDVGIIGGTTRSYISRFWSELSMSASEATFEQLPYIFEAGVAPEVASQDGNAGSGYIYAYVAPTTAQVAVNTYTIEGGDDQQAEEFDYGFVKSFNLSGEGQGALMLSAEWMGRETSNTTFTAVGALDTVEEILVNNGNLYIDNSGGTVGATTVSDTLFGINLDWTTGKQEFWTVDGSKDFNLVKGTGDEITLALTYEHNAAAVTEKGKYQDNSVRLIRLKFDGSTLNTAGTTYTTKELIIDLAGVYTDWSTLDDRDGNDVVEATFQVDYSVADTLKAEVIIVNELTVLS